jgi:alkylated DNA nucleotide flippase Atl1
MKKTWTQKIEDKKGFPKVLKLEKRFPCYNAVHKMGANEGDPIVLVNASEILPIMAKVPPGKLITIREICRKIAQNHKVKGCCSLTTGIFIMSIANAVEEAIARGDRSALAKIPYWRTLKADGFLNEKYPGGLEGHKKWLEKEGHQIIVRGKKFRVGDHDRKA